MSEQFKQKADRLIGAAKEKIAWLGSRIAAAWQKCRSWMSRKWQGIRLFLTAHYHRIPSPKRLFKRFHRKINPIRPDIPMVKEEARLAETKIKPVRPKPIRRKGRQRVYRLKGYTTVAKVNRKYKSEMQQTLLRKALILITILLVIILLYNLYNPFTNTDLGEWYRIIGISEWSDLFQDNPLLPDLTPTPPAP